MPRAIVAGHICLDIIPDLPGDLRIEPGRLVQSGPAQISTGGVVSNTGLALKKLNVDVGLVGKVGRDLFGQAILDRLAGSAQHMIVSAREASSYTIVVNLAGKDRMFLHCPGCNDSFRSLDVSDEVLREADFFHFGYPSLMKQMFEQDGDELVDLFRRARAAGVTTSLDVSLPDPGSPAGKANWKRIL